VNLGEQLFRSDLARYPYFHNYSDRRTGRFNLPTGGGKGTAYWSNNAVSALLEDLGPDFDKSDALTPAWFELRRITECRADISDVADVTSNVGWRVNGLTPEVCMVIPYDLPQAWAVMVHAAGYAGIWGLVRHDNRTTSRTLAHFGDEGTFADRPGFANPEQSSATTVISDFVRDGGIPVDSAPPTSAFSVRA
jgi:hypothetical protein